MGHVPQRLTILHTNDIHSHFEMVSPLAAEIERQRAAAGEEPVLLLDIGDHMDRAAVETEGTMGQANIDVLNLTGYDTVTIGNNEGLTFSQEMLSSIFSGLQCPVVCCNFVETATGEPPHWMKRHAILEKDGIRIGITGATAAFSSFYSLLGWDALDPETTLREQCLLLAPQVDILIILSHLGLPADRILAERLEGVHAILGGHTHHMLEEPLMINGTAVCGAGKFGRYLGRLQFERREGQTGFSLVAGECIPIDPELKEEVVGPAATIHLERGREALQQTVAITDRELPLNLQGESPFGNLLAQAVRRFTGASLSIVNTGQLLGPLPEGEVTTGMLHALCPSPINTCVIKLKGLDIRIALEQSLTEEFYNKVIFGYGFRGNYLGSLAVDGIKILYDPQQIPYDNNIAVFVEGNPLEDDKEYNVGTLDMFTFRAGYETIANGKDPLFLLPHFLRDLLGMELQRPDSLDECMLTRWQIKSE
ncbi:MULTISPECIES: bifunctional metallophosphatase/5'-nucleotidase [Paenibacillus]|uniref:bifunctional metallophosphatase/5'-nucleotidase n=1 Tax=Paenibacillus TaxID=44249 RepID=UPI0003E1EFB3|nr:MULTISPECIES: bifunctional UDP-sugar hydrolase/5'-nucleotidase [Paenibacillus]AIQ73354.1 5'-nucleotidase [Paenibacillus odorifer]ETT55799.1 5'-Nucleotidase domain-containing protein [Paenibacillus sp. FSL H8-237]MEC0134690.1 bifunctional UDP-sugar hydrolase/5'-nucleotidase [Paenibacillus odorifer]MEC0224227.1 bifunctional UDP-sugar hydrolase/5'-nucleotidase [Paenibacillus odorifer]OMC95675.1 multifunctional 2',3'-cyclic-nucleotide 2'-phosphodiesterase/5'-nucleotidase/3'-nucleotidase [Paenib